MSYLTTPAGVLKAQVITALEGQGFAYDPLRTTFAQYLATALGEPTAYLHKSMAQMLSEIDAQYGGSLSHLRASIARLLDDVAANIGAGGGGGGAYAAEAVHFDPGGSFQTLFDGLIGVPGNYDCGLFSCWVANISVADPGDVLVYIADDINAGFNINQNQASDFLVVSYDDPAGNRALAAEDDTFLLPIIGWKHVIVSAQKSTETLQCLVNGSPLGFALEPPIWGPGTGFGNSSGDTWSIIFTTAEVDFADLYFRLSNTFFDLTDPTNFAKFNVEGKPADPTGFPSGSWLTLTNGADGWTSTAASLGLTAAGTLTNASTSPSD